MKGYIKLHRKVKNSPIWCDSDKLRLWLFCLFECAFEEHEILIGNQKINIQKGQFITGRNELEKEFNKGVKKEKRVSGKTLFRWLELFQKCEMLSINKTNKYSVITVLNWSKYQVEDEIMSNKCPTSVQQVSNKCPQHKNVKECKEYIKEKNYIKKEKEFPITMILANGDDFEIHENDFNEWQRLFENLNVYQELLSMKSWLYANPRKRKTKVGMSRFINTWLTSSKNKKLEKEETESKEQLPSWYEETEVEKPDDDLLQQALERQKKLRQ